MPDQTLTAEDFMKGQDAPTPTSVAARLPNGQVLTQPDLDKLHPVIRKKILDKFGYEVDENGEPLSNASEGWGGLIHKVAHDLDPLNVASKFGRDFGKSVEKQGGWGLDEKLRQQLGADNPNTPPALQPLKDLPVNALDLGYRGIQSIGAGLDALPRTILPDSMVDDPVLSAFAVGEGGRGGDFRSPNHDLLPPEVRAKLNDTASQMFHNGATREEMDAWAKDNQMAPFGKELDAAIADRDAQYAKLKGEADNFKPTTDPKPTDVFPTDASRASDAEEWGKKLSPEEFMAGRDPEAVTSEPTTEPTPTVAPEEPTITKKDAEGQFKDELLPPKPQTTKEWEQQLKADAAEFSKKKAAPIPEAPVEAPPEAPADVVTRLTDTLNNASKLLPQQKKMYSEARSQKLAAARAAMATGGAAGYRKSMAALKGALPKVEINPIADKFNQEDIDSLFTQIQKSDKLSGFETVAAQSGLDKLLKGQLPNSSELSKMGKVFPNDFVKAVLKNRSKGQKGLDMFSRIYNLPRAIVSSVDASIPLRQGVFMVSRPEFYTSFGKMIKQMGSDKYYKETQEAIKRRPTYPLMEESGLSITDLSSDVSNRPEQFRSDLAEHIPVFKHLHHISAKGAVGFSNQLRADVFDKMVRQYKDVGVDLAKDPDRAKKVANYINNATGRGKVPFDKVGTAVGDIFFSPQLMASRLHLLNPGTYLLEKDPILRNNKLRDLAGFGGIAATAIMLAKLAGANVSSDPLSSDWGKIKIPAKGGAGGAASAIPSVFGVGVQTYKGETRYDIFGGMQQYVHLGAVLAMNERTGVKGNNIKFGEGYKPETRASTIGRFLRSKESPAASIVHDYLEGSDYIGNKFDLKKELISRLIPFSAQDIGQGVEPPVDAPTRKQFKDAPAPAPIETPTSNAISAEDFMKGDDVK